MVGPDPRQHEVDHLLKQALTGRVSRRDVLKRAAALGLSAPVIASLLAACGGGSESTPVPSSTGESGAGTATGIPGGTSTPGSATPAGSAGGDAAGRGRGKADLVRLLFWQAPTILNPHLSSGDKDASPARLVLEPLFNINPDGTLAPVLAAEVPSQANGGVAADGKSVTYKLKQGVVWSDGTPFTAEDVKFTWEWVTDPGTSATTAAIYADISGVEVVDDHTVTLRFEQPNPAWINLFSGGYTGHVLPKHLLADYKGEKAAQAPFNLRPIGTGPYKVVDFKPGDMVRFEINEQFRDPDKPYFKAVDWKGGGDPSTAARAVLQTGEADYAWNLQVESQVLESLSKGGAGELLITPGLSTEQVMFNFADPNTEVDGARAEPSTKHPFLTDKRVRQAMALACDRDTMESLLYGVTGKATANLLVQPERFVSKNTSYTFDLERAGALLDEAGWVKNGTYRAKDGKTLAVLFQTTVNSLRQKEQELIKASWEKLGIQTELKAIESGVFFSSDAGNPDTNAHFYADVQMFTNGPSGPYPLTYLAVFKSDDPARDLAQKSNSWSGRNLQRWVNEEFNRLYQEAASEIDPDQQVGLFVAMNDLLVNEFVRVSLIHRSGVNAAAATLKGIVSSVWEPSGYDIENWYFE